MSLRDLDSYKSITFCYFSSIKPGKIQAIEGYNAHHKNGLRVVIMKDW